MSNQPEEIEEFPILFIQEKFKQALAFLRAHGYNPKDADDAMGIRISAQAIGGKEELRAAAARVEQYADVMFDYAAPDESP